MRVVIVGGGVAGPAVALALVKTGKIAPADITILESGAANFDIGTYFTLQDNGLDALRTLGMLEKVMDAGHRTKRAAMYNDRGAVLADMSFGGSWTVRRSRVNQLLVEEAAAKGCVARYNSKLVSVEEPAGATSPLTAVLEDGSRIECELLVGADGIRSRVRSFIDPKAPAGGRYVGLVNYAGEGEWPRGVEAVAPEKWHMFFGRRAFFLYHMTKEGNVLWGVNEPRDAVTREERQATTSDQWRERLVALFEGDNGPMQQIIKASSIDLAGDNTCDMATVATWSRGRMVVVGDAVHAPSPTSGQGGSMALEDAIVLAMCIRDQPSLELAFRAYEANRRARVEQIVAHGARMSQSKMPGAIGRKVRDVMMPLLFKMIDFEKKNKWVVDYRIDWNQPLPLEGPPKPKRFFGLF